MSAEEMTLPADIPIENTPEQSVGTVNKKNKYSRTARRGIKGILFAGTLASVMGLNVPLNNAIDSANAKLREWQGIDEARAATTLVLQPLSKDLVSLSKRVSMRHGEAVGPIKLSESESEKIDLSGKMPDHLLNAEGKVSVNGQEFELRESNGKIFIVINGDGHYFGKSEAAAIDELYVRVADAGGDQAPDVIAMK